MADIELDVDRRDPGLRRRLPRERHGLAGLERNHIIQDLERAYPLRFDRKSTEIVAARVEADRISLLEGRVQDLDARGWLVIVCDRAHREHVAAALDMEPGRLHGAGA